MLRELEEIASLAPNQFRRPCGLSLLNLQLEALCPQRVQTFQFLIEPHAFVFPLWTRPLLAGRAFLLPDGGGAILCFGPPLTAASTARSNRDHADSSAASRPSDLVVLVMTRNPDMQPTPPPSDILHAIGASMVTACAVEQQVAFQIPRFINPVNMVLFHVWPVVA